jgi:CheY-like chemotaxis protein
MSESYTILLADDDPDDQELIVHAFSEISAYCNLHIVNDGRQAIEFLSGMADSKLPCLIVLDYNMPELNGAQVLQKLTDDKRYEKIPKIILSTSANPVYINDCLGKGASAYRVKPDNFTQLVILAKEMMGFCGNAA